jgi:histone deacetylase 1/2
VCWPSLRKYNAHKLVFRSKQCVFLGYSPMHKVYKCLDKSTGHIYISRDVVFDESVFPYATLGISVDVPTHRQAITFPSTEPATHDHVRQYDLSYLSTNPPFLVDALPMQVPLASDSSAAIPNAAAPSATSAPSSTAAPSPAVADESGSLSAAAAPAAHFPADMSQTYL